jgi:thiol-disulfide isomerase/thioredoxin
MLRKRAIALLILLASTRMFAQNFSFSPEHPKAGDLVTIYYTPAGAIAGTMKKVEASYYMLGSTPTTTRYINADDLKLTRDGNRFTTTIQTDTAANFIFFGFASNKQFDNNFNNGYYILLSDGDHIKKGAHAVLSGFYQGTGRNVGVDPDNGKALAELENEFAAYPEERKRSRNVYLRLMMAQNKPEANASVQKEIESVIKDGLKTEEDYNTLEYLYSLVKLPEQAKMIASMRKEKFPAGQWKIRESLQDLNAEKDPVKYASLVDVLENKVQTDPDWKFLEPSLNSYRQTIVYRYLARKDVEGMKSALAKLKFASDADKAFMYNNLAWELQGTGTDLKTAEDLSRFAAERAKKEMDKPTVPKPPYLTTRQWQEQRRSDYAMFADTYGMVLYRTGDFKKGLPFSKDAAINIGEGRSADENTTYALLAEKALPLSQYKAQLEQFVKDGKATAQIKEILKRAYVKQGNSESGFDNYIMALEKESYQKMMEELRKSMLNQAAPNFALLDLDGKKVNISDLKDKVVVVDFWATWCGPCKASFPAMQKMVSKYKDDPSVKFVFIDTWENVEEKQKNAADFISTNKYTFHVLLDTEDKTVSQFNVDGIPTKFVIDKNGTIRFKSVGFDGNDDKLVSELTAMIEMASQQGGSKTF